MGAIVALVFLLLISPAVYGQTTHTVGDSNGWGTGVNYADWTKGKTFSVGDSLTFNYDFTHAVDEVDKAGYDGCSSSNAISSDSSSPTTITLSSSSAGTTRYFICPRSNHCSQGMKLAVTVAASGGTSPPSSGGPSPPSSGGSTPPATSTPSSPSPPKDNAATTLAGGKSLMVVVLGAMLGLIG